MKEKFCIVGLGLMGASLGLRIKQCLKNSEVVGISRSKEKLKKAIEKGIIDKGVELPPSDTQLLIFSTPVKTIPSLLKKLLPSISPQTIITDVGSTKNWLWEKISAFLPSSHTYIGSHPLCGSEKQGMDYANPEIFSHALCFITCLDFQNDKISKLKNFWESLGMKTILTTPEKHDLIVAFTSHLPHIIAVNLLNTLPDEFTHFTGEGFRDTTRIGEGGADIWEDILVTNIPNLLKSMEIFEKEWNRFKTALKKEEIKELLEKARKKRFLITTFDKTKLPLQSGNEVSFP